MYLGLYEEEGEAAEAYDQAVILVKVRAAITRRGSCVYPVALPTGIAPVAFTLSCLPVTSVAYVRSSVCCQSTVGFRIMHGPASM